MKTLLAILVLVAAAQAQNLVDDGKLPNAPSHHQFWSLETKVNTGILAGLITADAITTQKGLNQGMREANPLMRPFVTRGAAGEAVGSAIGMGSALGVVYVLHKTNHHKAEKIAMRLMIGVEGTVVASNIAALR